MRNDRNVGINFFFLKKYDKVSCMHLGHTRRVNSLSPEVVKLSLSVIVVENGDATNERERWRWFLDISRCRHLHWRF